MSIRKTRHEYIKNLQIVSRIKKVIKKIKREPVKEKVWEFGISSLSLYGNVLAFTRSEARSRIKKKYNIKGRLPLDTEIVLHE